MAETNLRYTALNKHDKEIRLVQVLPSRDAPEIWSEIKAYPLEKAPQYVALSYAWGRPDPNCHIYLNGRPVPVRKNLLRFLRQMSTTQRHSHRLFWIDALCINQADTEERTHQVGLMSQIYGNAHQVFVWLGPAYADSGRAILALRAPSKISTKAFWWSASGAAVSRLCQRPYWSRLWVLQELVLAKDIVLICGHVEIKWGCLTSFLNSQRTMTPPDRGGPNHEHKATFNSPGVSMIDQVKVSRSDITLLDQMRRSSSLRCAEPRDRVYALLGIVSSGTEGLQPDYEEPMSLLLNSVIERDFCIASPASLAEVRSRCEELSNLMGLAIETMFHFEDSGRLSDDRNPAFHHEESGISLWWAHHYQHDHVCDLFVDEYGLPNLLKDFSYASEEGLDESVGLLLGLNCAQDICQHWVPDLFYNNVTSGVTPLHRATANGHVSTVQLILRHSSSWINVQQWKQGTPLQLAVSRNNERMVRALLVAKGIDTSLSYRNSIDGTEWSLLAQAAKLGHKAIVSALLSHDGFDVNGVPCDIPPLVAAAAEGHVPVVQTLLDDSRTNVNARSLALGTALYAAAGNGHTSVVEELLCRDQIQVNLGQAGPGVTDTPLRVAAQNGRERVVELFLRRQDMDVNEAEIPTTLDPEELVDLRTPLHSAVENGHSNVVKLLLEHPNISVNRLERSLSCPLHAAVEMVDLEPLKLLLAHPGIQVNVEDEEYQTPLVLAVLLNHDLHTSLLVQKSDIDVNAVDKYGRTALKIATEEGYRAIGDILLGTGKALNKYAYELTGGF